MQGVTLTPPKKEYCPQDSKKTYLMKQVWILLEHLLFYNPGCILRVIQTPLNFHKCYF